MAAHIGRRLRKSAMTTTVAAVAVAALSASQAPDVTAGADGRQSTADSASSADPGSGDGATGNSPYYTDLPPLDSPVPSPSSTIGTSVTQGSAESGIPATVLDAYKKAEASLRASKPGCNLPWELLAAIGKVESGQARGGAVTADGTTTSPILGPQLDGNGFALIKDTDNGAYDGNSEYDQAVGPMQFIPSTWAWAGRDGNGDGEADPNNIYDAALAAGHYLCRNSWDLSDQDDLDAAILSYNNSTEYLHTVLSWLEYYRKGSYEIPDGTGTLPVGRSDDDTTASPSTSPSTGSSNGSGRSTSPATQSPSPSDPAPSTPPATDTPSPGETSPPQTPTDTVARLENAGTGKLSAMAGDAFTERISTRAETAAGKAVGKVRVRFTVIGATDAEFTTGESVATVVTDSSGVATAPALRAGEKTGGFLVRATVVGRAVPGLDYKATVTQRVADTVVRTSTTALTCAAGGTFADQVEVKATYKDAVADRVAATATLITSATDATENDKGPYFKDADGKAVRSLTDLETDAKGLLKLPTLYADDTTGTFLLRITTAGGASVDVELTVEPAETVSPSPSETTSASASASASPSA
ncbi:lytic transglycosylase domain-containing protein [Streptomyces sp. ISL-12]|uniref:lytic transglycosylase domain-containing protein n=1 Tax=Streptomyces sp. ISL-12 TaxID=2819177 RepID=UPI001BE86CEC|nr:lytic murein transglycosylase [Streptomyces sp. ISL-12]MBT2411839.1 lytic transglycosylase domain-containing protein [Streptomyces sp. ISL-12]